MTTEQIKASFLERNKERLARWCAASIGHRKTVITEKRGPVTKKITGVIKACEVHGARITRCGTVAVFRVTLDVPSGRDRVILCERLPIF